MLIKVFVSALLALWSVQMGYSADEWSDLITQGRAFYAAGKYLDAIQAFRQAQDIAERPNGGLGRLAIQ